MQLNPELVYEPRRIISMVGPSRSGSSIIKYALSLHPELTSLAGEEEPYYKLACNGYPWHDSDEFYMANMMPLIRMCIANELHGHKLAENRWWLQHHGIEERPFVSPILLANVTDTLLLKTPQNVYRRTVLEKLYPKAKIDYIVTRRNRYCTINGLMDGWMSNDFEARELREPLRVIEHQSSDVLDFNWWKFDMPPGCRVLRRWPVYLHDICAFQADTAARYAAEQYSDALVIDYENFLMDWRGVTQYVWEQLGLDKFDLSGHNLPVLMATDSPGVGRWKEKRPWLSEVC